MDDTQNANSAMHSTNPKPMYQKIIQQHTLLLPQSVNSAVDLPWNQLHSESKQKI